MSQITSLLRAWENGDRAALDEVTTLVHEQLHRMARLYLRNKPEGCALQPTEILNEAYLRLLETGHTKWQDRNHFLAVSAQIMRRIVVDAARAQASQKRGGGAKHVGYSTAGDLCASTNPNNRLAGDLLALDEALERLKLIDPRKTQVIELRFFGGLEIEEIARVLEISPQTVMRDWRLARAWLARELRA
jgi:RNA polymerase sigma factor (TIGR02999 family)